MPTATKDHDADQMESQASVPQSITVKQGNFIQLQAMPVAYADGRSGFTQNWVKCNDVNQRLHRDLSAIAVALEDFTYDPQVGATNDQVKSFKLRQYWQDPNCCQVAYSRSGLAKWLNDLAIRLHSEIPAAIGPVIRKAIAEFENHYKGELPDN